MGEVIHIREILRQREISHSRERDRESLERAVDILKQNLEVTAREIVEAPAADQNDLLRRADRLIAMIRYGMHMLGDAPEDEQILEMPRK